MLGGNIGSRFVGDRVHLDVYPHMYLNWYRNFWALLDGDRDRRAVPPDAGRQAAARRRLPALHRAGSPVPALGRLSQHARRADLARGHVPLLLRGDRPDGRDAAPDDDPRRRQRQRLPARPPVHDRADRRALQQPDHQRLGHPELPRGGRRLPGLPRVQRRRRGAAVLARPRLGAGAGDRRAGGASSSPRGSRSCPTTQIVSATCAEGRVREIGLRASRWDPHTHAGSRSGARGPSRSTSSCSRSRPGRCRRSCAPARSRSCARHRGSPRSRD